MAAPYRNAPNLTKDDVLNRLRMAEHNAWRAYRDAEAAVMATPLKNHSSLIATRAHMAVTQSIWAASLVALDKALFKSGGAVVPFRRGGRAA